MHPIEAMREIEQRLFDAMKAGDEKVIRDAARTVVCAAISGPPYPDSVYRIRDIAPELWCEVDDCTTASQMCDHGINETRRRMLKEYRGVPPWLIARLEGRLDGLSRVLIPDGADAILKINTDRVRERWAADREVTIEVRLRGVRADKI